MAKLLNRVQAGELITAERWNTLVDAVNELLQGSQSSAKLISAMVPAGTSSEPIRLGQGLQIVGQNFGVSTGQTTVTFRGPSGDVVVDHSSLQTGSTDTRLLLVVPPSIPGLPATGDLITLVVSNGVGSDTRSVFVTPVIISLEGDVFVSFRAGAASNPNPNPLQPDRSAEFLYQVRTGTNLPAPFDLAVNIPNATTSIPAGLVQSIELLENNAPIQNRRIEMGTNDTRNIAVRIPLMPTSFANQTFTLQVTASSGGLTGTDTRSFTVGQVVTPPDPNIIALETGSVVMNAATLAIETDPANGRLEGSTIRLRAGRLMVVQFNVRLTQMGDYDLTQEVKAGSTLTNWQLQLVNTPNPIRVATNGSTVSHLVQFGVTAQSGASPSGTVIFRIKRQGATQEWTKEYDVVLLV